MSIPKKVLEYLKKSKKAFEGISHKTVYTAYDLAQTLKTELKGVAKALLLSGDNGFVVAIVPASARVNLKKLKKALGFKKISFSNEKDMIKIFKIKPGALSAFGKLHKIETVVDKSLLKAKDIILQAGSFTESVRMKAKDFIDMEKAKLADFSESAGYVLQKKAKSVKKVLKRKKK